MRSYQKRPIVQIDRFMVTLLTSDLRLLLTYAWQLYDRPNRDGEMQGFPMISHLGGVCRAIKIGLLGGSAARLYRKSNF